MKTYALYNNLYLTDPSNTDAFRVEVKVDVANQVGTFSEVKVNEKLFTNEDGFEQFSQFIRRINEIGATESFTEDDFAFILLALRLDIPKDIFQWIKVATLLNFNLGLYSVDPVEDFSETSQGFYQLNVQS